MIRRLQSPLALAAILFIFAFILAVAMQWQLGAFVAAIENDPAAHYVSAALIHDWITTWPLQPPLKFLSEFHAHYPVVGLGVWPPAYHVLLAAWMMVQPTGFWWALLFSALVTGAFAMTAGLATRGHGWSWSIATAAAVVLSPIVRTETAQVMLDILTAAFCFGAALAYARFLRTGRWQDSVLFGIAAVIALYTKGNALALIAFPLLALLFARQAGMLRRWAFWAAAPAVVLLAGPWYYFTAGRTQEGARFVMGLAYTMQAVPFYARAMLDLAGPVVLGLAVVGLVRGAWLGLPPMLAACGALVIAAFGFHVVAPIALQDRYVLMALPGLLVLAASVLKQVVPGWGGPVLLAASVAVWTAAVGPHAFPVSGFSEAAQAARGAVDARNPVVLIATDAQTEAGLVAQLASIDTQRPSLWALRGSRLLGGGGFNNHEYTPRYADVSDVLGALSQYSIRFVLLRHTGVSGEWSHVGQVAQLSQGSEPWRMLARVPHPGGDIVLLEVPGQAGRVADPAALNRLAGPRWMFSSKRDDTVNLAAGWLAR